MMPPVARLAGTGKSLPHRRGAFILPPRRPRHTRAEGQRVADRVAAKPSDGSRVRPVRMPGLSRRGWTLVRPEAKTQQTGRSDARSQRPDPRRTYAGQPGLDLMVASSCFAASTLSPVPAHCETGTLILPLFLARNCRPLSPTHYQGSAEIYIPLLSICDSFYWLAD